MHAHWSRLGTGCLVTLAAAVSAVAIAVTPAAGRSHSGSLDGVVQELVRNGIPGAAALERDGSRTRVSVAGVAELESGRPLGPSAPFRAGSVTKTFVATVVLQLVAEGRLRLGDTVERRLPGLLPYGRKVTIRQLLQHTSGIPDHLTGPNATTLLAPLLDDPSHPFAPLELVRSIANEPLRASPGSRWQYSNTNYVLLGMIVERVTGEPLARVLGRRIVSRLALRGTSLPSAGGFPVAGLHGYLLPGNPFLPTPGGRPVDVTGINPSFTWAAGALVSTLRDLDRFERALLGGRLLPKPLLREMTSARPMGAGTAYGLGLLRVTTPCGPAYGHDGEIFGYTTLMLTSRDTRRSVVLLASASHPSESRPDAILAALLDVARKALCAPA